MALDGADEIIIQKTDKFRGGENQKVNADYDMIRITLDMPIWVWRGLRKILIETAIPPKQTP